MKELILIDSKIIKEFGTTWKEENYKFRDYEITYHFKNENGEIKNDSFLISTENNYIPNIYYNNGFIDGKKEFWISCPNFSIILFENIEKIMNGLNDAYELIKILTDKFIG